MFTWSLSDHVKAFRMQALHKYFPRPRRPAPENLQKGWLAVRSQGLIAQLVCRQARLVPEKQKYFVVLT